MATIKRRYTLRLQDETFEKVAYIANKEKRSVAMQMEYILSKFISEFEKEYGEIDTSIE